MQGETLQDRNAPHCRVAQPGQPGQPDRDGLTVDPVPVALSIDRQ